MYFYPSLLTQSLYRLTNLSSFININNYQFILLNTYISLVLLQKFVLIKINFKMIISSDLIIISIFFLKPIFFPCSNFFLVPRSITRT